MRQSVRKGNVMVYSPDDFDYCGFVLLIQGWVNEAKLPVSQRTVADFCKYWSGCEYVNLLTKQEWLKRLMNWEKQ